MLDTADYEKLSLSLNTSILDAIWIIDQAILQIALVAENSRTLLGTVTDGNIRRGIFFGIKLRKARKRDAAPILRGLRANG